MQLGYMENRLAPRRRKTLEVRVRDRVIGGDAPILVQSMTTTNTADIDATVAQVLGLYEAGCELVRITAPTAKDAECLRAIAEKVRAAGCEVPISADIHFQPRAAFEAIKWVDKVRINPGNFVDSKGVTMRKYDDTSFAAGEQKVFDTFAPLVREARERGVCLRIGTNHGSLSDRMMWRFGDTIEGMVESALEYLRVCEAENFDQIVFSMKSSNPRVAVQAYRMLAMRLDQGHKPYPFHVGVTEAGDGEDGRLKSAVGIGALLLDGLGDTVRVSLTEDPCREIPVARQLVEICDTRSLNPLEVPSALPEEVDFYAYQRREVPSVALKDLIVGGREKIAVGCPNPGAETLPKGERRIEWLTTHDAHQLRAGIPMVWEPAVIRFAVGTSFDLISLRSSQLADGVTDFPPAIEIVVENPMHLERLPADIFTGASLFWSVAANSDQVAHYRYLAAWLTAKGRRDPIILRGESSGDPVANMALAARLGSLLVDGIGDMLHITGPLGARATMNLGYDILQAAGVRKSKPEYVSCPSCGRTLFDLETTTQKIRARTSHLKDISIAIMGCIVNGPGEMADADFGYVGGAPNKVNLYVGRECVKKNIPEAEAPEALVSLIREHGRWREAEPIESN